MYVTVTNRDTVVSLDTSTRTVARTVSVGRKEGIGTAPLALAETPDGRTLYVADSGNYLVRKLDQSLVSATATIVDPLPRLTTETLNQQSLLWPLDPQQLLPNSTELLFGFGSRWNIIPR